MFQKNVKFKTNSDSEVIPVAYKAWGTQFLKKLRVLLPRLDSQELKIVVEKFSGRVDVQEGEFGAFMKVELINDGPVTILLESKNGKLLN